MYLEPDTHSDTPIMRCPGNVGDVVLDNNSPARRPRTSLGTAFIVFYAASVLLFLALPGAVSNWLDEFEPNPIVQAAKEVVEPMTEISEYVGVSDVHGNIRRVFLSLSRRRTGADDRLSSP
jgi:hypothetical protein